MQAPNRLVTIRGFLFRIVVAWTLNFKGIIWCKFTK